MKLEQKLTLIEHTTLRDKYNRILSKYQCECGTVIDLPKYKVEAGIKKTCGCHIKYRKKNLTEGLKEGEDFIVIKHSAGSKKPQEVVKLRKMCVTCNKDLGFAFKASLTRPCSSCSAKKRAKLSTTIAHNFYGDRALFNLGKKGKFITRSTYETFYADYLIKSNIEFEYEPTKFDLSDGSTYLPDFYLPATDEYVEVKGLMRPKDMHKIDMFRSDFPDKKLKVIRQKDLEGLGYKLRNYTKVVPINAAGAKWKFRLMSDRNYIKEHGDDSAGMTVLSKKEVHIRESTMTLAVLRHEMMHVMFDSCNTYSANLTPDQVEEVCCDIFAYHGDDMMWKTLMIYKLFYVSLYWRTRDYVKELPCYKEYKEDVKPKLEKLIKVIKESKITGKMKRDIDGGFYDELFELEAIQKK